MAQTAMFNPQNEQNRNHMNDSYGIQLPLINDPRSRASTVSFDSSISLGLKLVINVI